MNRKSKVSFHCMQSNKPQADLFLWPQFVASVLVHLAHQPDRNLSLIFQIAPLICILFVWLCDFSQKLEKLSRECQHLPTHFHPYTSNTHHLETSWGAWHVPLDLLHESEFQCKRLSCLIKELMSSCSFKYNPQNTCAHLFWYVFSQFTLSFKVKFKMWRCLFRHLKGNHLVLKEVWNKEQIETTSTTAVKISKWSCFGRKRKLNSFHIAQVVPKQCF